MTYIVECIEREPIDSDKQQAINLFLGMFKPRLGQMDLWELPTDYYLHHTKTTELPSKEQTYRCGVQQ